jgi:hypothetical protein
VEAFDAISETHRAFIEAQHLFFVASAPLSASGHVNLSPKGLDTLRVLTPNRVAYLDHTGSGNESSAHIRENGRITFMFCAFNGPPLILRLYATGKIILPGEADWPSMRALFPGLPGARQIIVADVHRVQTSCGYGVPDYSFDADRDTLVRWTNAKGEDGIREYWRDKNSATIDGIPTPLGDHLSR